MRGRHADRRLRSLDVSVTEDSGSDGSISDSDPEELSEESSEESPEHGRGDRADANDHESSRLTMIEVEDAAESRRQQNHGI